MIWLIIKQKSLISLQREKAASAEEKKSVYFVEKII
jgi:hypothetical protein